MSKSFQWLGTVFVVVWRFWSAGGASIAETSSLIAAASLLGIAPGTWNFSSDPCVGGWRGVGCCSNNSQSPCCTVPPIYPPTPPITTCDHTVDAQISTLIIRSDLFGQVLNGTLPEALCNLTALQILDVGLHRLRGQVPGCIGSRLTRLQILRLGDNRFSGSIPEELGQLSNLQELYLDSTNISGFIPSSLGSLSRLRRLSLRSNGLEGDIPPEIGELRNLEELELQVNRLTGGIPRSFANLTALGLFMVFNNELSGVINSSIFSSMTRLREVSLRYNRFSGPVPDFGFGSSLSSIDLGFNDFSGPLPNSLGNLRSLTSLFVDHNRLNGSLPSTLNPFPALSQLDLSHNMLGGSLEALPGNAQLQLDVSFNLFNISTASSSFPLRQDLGSNAYFNCIPSSSTGTCSRSTSGRGAFFAVNAGSPNGTTVRSGNGVTVNLQPDVPINPTNLSLGFFYGSGFALELSGRLGGAFGVQSSINMTGAGDSPEELYQTMRWSSSYIAYHGYSLRPGNYTVSLYFAELVFTEPGYRIFDVVLQGRVVRENLDIAGEAGAGAAYVLRRNITVDNNGSVSVELVYRGRDRYLDVGGWQVRNAGPTISAVSVVSFDYRGDEQGSTSLSSSQISGIAAGAIAAAIILSVAVFLVCRRKNKKAAGAPRTPATPTSEQVSFLDAGRTFTYEELSDATQGFSNKLGEGGFGAVYKGTLPGGTAIAVKQLTKHTQQVEDDFKREISLISKVRHKNLLAVIGYSLESDIPMLVCEFIPNGSLDKWLFPRRGNVLSWSSRREIAAGVACGLAYLHDESKFRIIHCDVKPANILLDVDFNPRLADFGLARLYDEKESHVTATRLKGTAGYLAPEYAMHLQLSDKVDVYSFGVVLLELLSGRRAVELSAPSERIVLVDWAHKEAEIPSNMLEIIDQKLQGEYVEQEARDMTSIAILCTQRSPALRPKMQVVWLMLTGALKVPHFLENLQAVVPSSSGGSTSQSLSSGNIGETSISAAFRTLKEWAGAANTHSFSSEKPVTL